MVRGRAARGSRQDGPSAECHPAVGGKEPAHGRGVSRAHREGGIGLLTPEHFNRRGANFLPGHLGIVITEIGPGRVCAELEVTPLLMAPNGYLHAGGIVTLADTCAGYGCVANLPDGAAGFTTIELKSNHLGTAREGILECVATALHMGATTHVWDAVVRRKGLEKPIALFRCTQMILYARADA